MAGFVINSNKKEYEQFTCRIETDLMDNIRKIVKEKNLKSINSFINDCLRFSIKHIDTPEEDENNK